MRSAKIMQHISQGRMANPLAFETQEDSNQFASLRHRWLDFTVTGLTVEWGFVKSCL